MIGPKDFNVDIFDRDTIGSCKRFVT